MYLIAWFAYAIALLSFVFIVRFFIKFNRRKQRILKYVKHLSSPKEYPFIGSGLRFFAKNSQGSLKFQNTLKMIK